MNDAPPFAAPATAGLLRKTVLATVRSTALLALVAVAGAVMFAAGEAHAKGRSKHAAHNKSHSTAKSRPASRTASRPASRPMKAAARPAPKLQIAAKAPASSASPQPDSPIAEPSPQKPIQVLSREEILKSDADRLERIGRHLIIGFHSLGDVKALVEKRAIAGIFITAHNVRNRSASAIKTDIDALQAIRVEQGLPPLIIAADQEGGNVSRLSPPLKRQTSLARVIKDLTTDDARKKAVEDYAEAQAAELKRIGVTLNFAPVVDLNLSLAKRDDGETRLRTRAIAADPYLVAKVAGWYCDKVAAAGIMCTLKHFPGLGRVARDTHVTSGEIAAGEGQLILSDWVPFRRVMQKPNAATMLGHVRVGVIDKDTPASYSKPLIDDLIRKRWAFDGLLITDDFSMGAITRSKSGVGAAAVKSLQAGADLVLVSFIENHLNSVISALLAADADNTLDRATTAMSGERIARIVKAVAQPPAKTAN